MANFTVFVVDDEPGILEVCCDSLARIEGLSTRAFANPEDALAAFSDAKIDLLLSDIQMPQMSGIELLRRVRELDPDVPVVILTGFPSIETAVEAIRLGAVDYVAKPFHPDELIATVRRMLEIRQLREENRMLKRHVEGRLYAGEMLGVSPQMQVVFDTIERTAGSDVDVMIQGETGTGKELVARAVHRHSPRVEKPFVPVNCSAIPENLLEAEFFGHEKGAFTGAHQRSIGLLEYADGGTLFLDEVVELPLQMQAKLLRVLQERTFRRVGARQEIAFDVRVISASARSLAEAAADGVFREDLYYRLNVVHIQLPPLRERREDLELLVNYFFERYANEMGKDIHGVSQQTLAALDLYSWPGNIRELQNVIRRSIAMAKSDIVELTDLPDYVAAAGDFSPDGAEEAGATFQRLRHAYISRFERNYFDRLLNAHQGDVSAVAAEADLPRGSVYRLLKKYEIDPADYR